MVKCTFWQIYSYFIWWPHESGPYYWFWFRNLHIKALDTKCRAVKNAVLYPGIPPGSYIYTKWHPPEGIAHSITFNKHIMVLSKCSDGVSNHQPHDRLLNRLCRHRSTKSWKLRDSGFYAGNSPVTGEFPAQRASNAENVSIWWRHHAPVVYTHDCCALYYCERMSGSRWTYVAYSSKFARIIPIAW